MMNKQVALAFVQAVGGGGKGKQAQLHAERVAARAAANGRKAA